MLIFQLNDKIREEEVEITPQFFKFWYDYINANKDNKIILLPNFIDYICNSDTQEQGTTYDFIIDDSMF